MTEHIKPLLLLQETGWIHQLACHLAGPDQDADDLAQDTLIAAMESGPPRLELRPWLRGIARRLQARRIRDNSRRRAREQSAAPAEPLPSTESLAMRLDMQRTVVDAVLDLDEPHRDAVLWHYFEGRSPAEIATALGVPASTVYSRLRRAREQLRERLDRDSGGRAVWVAALGVPGLGAETGLAVGLTWKVAAAVLILAGASYYWPSSLATEAATQGALQAAVIQPPASTPQRPLPVAAQRVIEPGTTAPARLQESTTQSRDVRIRILESNGKPASACEVGVALSDGEHRRRTTRFTDADGFFSIDWKQESRDLDVVVEDPIGNQWARAEVSLPQTEPLTIQWTGPRQFQIEVVGPDGKPQTRFQIFVLRVDSFPKPITEDWCRKQISFQSIPLAFMKKGPRKTVNWEQPRLPSDWETHDAGQTTEFIPPWRFVVAIVVPGFPVTWRGPWDPAETPEHVRFDLAPTDTIGGTVLADGEPVEGATVGLYAAPLDETHSWSGVPLSLNPVAHRLTRTDSMGRYELPASLDRFAVQAHVPRRAPSRTETLTRADVASGKPLDLILEPGGSIAGRVLAPEGESPAGISVGVSCGDAFSRHVEAGPDGSFRFDHLTPGRWVVCQVESRPWHSWGAVPGSPNVLPTNTEVRSGEVTEFDLDLRDGLTCRVHARLRVDTKTVEGEWRFWQTESTYFGLRRIALAPEEGGWLRGEVFESGPGQIRGRFTFDDVEWAVESPITLRRGDTRWECSWKTVTVNLRVARGESRLLAIHSRQDDTDVVIRIPVIGDDEVQLQVPAGPARVVAVPESWDWSPEFEIPGARVSGGRPDIALERWPTLLQFEATPNTPIEPELDGVN